MKLADCITRIEGYLKSDDMRPRFVDVQDAHTLAEIKQQFDVGSNRFLSVEEYCGEDDNPHLDSFFNDLEHMQGWVFLTGFTTFYMLMGEQILKEVLISSLYHLSGVTCKLIVLTYQCEKYLQVSDPRLSKLLYVIDGEKTPLPQIIFTGENIPYPKGSSVLNGIKYLPSAIETKMDDVLYVVTQKGHDDYPLSLIHFKEDKDAFEILKENYMGTMILDYRWGTDDQWCQALKKVDEYGSWEALINGELGQKLEYLINDYYQFSDWKKWLYFVGIKMNGTFLWCLDEAVQKAPDPDRLICYAYRSILSKDCHAPDYWDDYAQWKKMISSFGYPMNEDVDYCLIVAQKQVDALYYMSDSSPAMRKKIMELLSTYAISHYEQQQILNILKNIYPDLYAYLQPYPFKQALLSHYFQEYKYQKVVNYIYPSFLEQVEEQAVKREYNLFLPTRSEVIDALDKKDACLCFVDAMGVEFLSYIVEMCKTYGLMTYTTVCRCELPSITACNKGFVQKFIDGGGTVYPNINGIKRLDKIKHHGDEKSYNYNLTKAPVYLAEELQVLDDLIKEIKVMLLQGECQRVVMASDHGASRLAVINEKTLKVDVNSKGTHGGRVCAYTEDIILHAQATHEGDYYVLADYNCFKGGRAGIVETHGGATLEEVAVPVIEIVKKDIDYEITVLTPLVTFSRMKKNGKLLLFSKVPLQDVSVAMSDQFYPAETTDNQNFSIPLPDLRKVGPYTFDVYSGANKICAKLLFTAEKEGFKERDLF